MSDQLRMLPPLPEPLVYEGDAATGYTADQMREYAQATLTAAAVGAPSERPQLPFSDTRLDGFSALGSARAKLQWMLDNDKFETLAVWDIQALLAATSPAAVGHTMPTFVEPGKQWTALPFGAKKVLLQARQALTGPVANGVAKRGAIEAIDRFLLSPSASVQGERLTTPYEPSRQDFERVVTDSTLDRILAGMSKAGLRGTLWAVYQYGYTHAELTCASIAPRGSAAIDSTNSSLR